MHSRRRQPLTLCAICRARPGQVQGHGAGRDVWPRYLSSDWRAALLAYARAPLVFLVYSREAIGGRGYGEIRQCGGQYPEKSVARVSQLLQEEDGREALAAVLPDYLRRCRWFGGKARQIYSATMVEAVRFSYASTVAYITALRIDYTEGDPETYVLPLLVATGETLARVQQELPHAVVARVTGLDGEGLFYEAVWDNDFSRALLEAIVRRRRFKGIRGELVGVPTQALPQFRGVDESVLMPSLLKAEQSNTSVIYGDKLILKLFRRVGEGVNPDWEVGRFLTEKTAFAHTAPVAGALEYRGKQGEPVTVAILHAFVPNQGDAWRYTLDVLDRYFEVALTQPANVEPVLPPKSVLALVEDDSSSSRQRTDWVLPGLGTASWSADGRTPSGTCDGRERSSFYP